MAWSFPPEKGGRKIIPIIVPLMFDVFYDDKYSVNRPVVGTSGGAVSIPDYPHDFGLHGHSHKRRVDGKQYQ